MIPWAKKKGVFRYPGCVVGWMILIRAVHFCIGVREVEFSNGGCLEVHTACTCLGDTGRVGAFISRGQALPVGGKAVYLFPQFIHRSD